MTIFNSRFRIGDSVWTSEFNEKDGWFHVFNRSVEYIKDTASGIVYGFTYGIECLQDQCFHTEEMAKLCAYERNKEILKKRTN